MADTFPRVAGSGSSRTKCRDARQRRLHMRRLMAMPSDAQSSQAAGGDGGQGGEKRRDGPGEGATDKRSRSDGSNSSRRPPIPPPPPPPPPPSSSSPSLRGGGGAQPFAPSSGVPVPAEERPPTFGCVSLSGRSREMEDAVSLHPGFFSGVANGGSPLHFFAVFDGHGGSHVSELCKERMHSILAEELLRGAAASGNDGGEVTVEEMKAALFRSFQRMDELALAACACGMVGEHCPCEQREVSMEIVGSTAVVALVGRDRVVVANCGDSRAVLGRGGRAFPLSSDQKPDRPDELARIEEAGGRVIYVNGARVLGILAMSRALGDRYLKPVVISEPEISVVERRPEDEFLIIASDGLWDVLSNNLACQVTRRCFRDGRRVAQAESLGPEANGSTEATRVPRSHCSVAAALLTRLALARKTSDNISVIVVDLRST